ncbi:OmpA family protein [Nitrincola alkalilacustris]|uniref:OmpA family protein n=1 Tax=Nitrincola alkalilacustris TaxID=1571224 RepID=UPI00124E81FC|nr:OmpA family protein [Nitrincola alkalilacustris]
MLLLLAACQTVPSGLNAKQVEVLKQNGFELTDQGWLLNLSNKLLFGFDAVAPGEEEKELTSRLATSLLEVNITQVRLEGHTDSIGTQAYNDTLSLNRARTVQELFIEAGFNPDSISVQGLGSRYPVADNDTEEGRSENRRVSIIVQP